MRLVICIGNEARGDDGAAREVARRLEGTPGLRVLSAPQLDVTMAEEIAGADSVTFVDAERRDVPPTRVHTVTPAPLATSATTHALDPQGLLALADALYGRAPAAEIVTVAAPSMGHGGELSAVAQAAVRRAVGLLASGSSGTGD